MRPAFDNDQKGGKQLIRSILAAGAAAFGALVVVTAGFGGSTATPTTLKGTVGPGHTINLTTATGRQVKTVKAGTYRITVSDRSGEHNFMLGKAGGTPQQLTQVGWSGAKTVTVKLTNGTWSYFSAPHADQMVGKFGVGGAASAAATPPTRATNGNGGSGSGDDDGDDGDH